VQKVLVDTDIILDLLAERKPFYSFAAQLFSMADKKEIKLFVPSLTFSNINYLLSRKFNNDKARKLLIQFIILITVLSVDDKIIRLALASEFKDFEDAIQYHTAIENEINNVAFLRIYIDHITDYFAKDEVSEIWLTFPDPQPKKGHIKKRLTNKKFIDLYSQILSKSGSLHLKTDSELMFEYTNEVIAENKINCIRQTSDLYNSDLVDEILSVKTTYEQKFLEIGSTIKYIEFTL